MIKKLFYFVRKCNAYLLLLCFSSLCSSCELNDHTLVVATAPDNPPYEYLENEKIVGFDVDLINAIAQKLDKQVEWVSMPFSNLLPALENKMVDVIVAGFSYSQERADRVSLSDTYHKTNIYLLSDATGGDISSLDNLRNKKIGATLGTIWTAIAQSIALTHKAFVVVVDNMHDLMRALDNKNINVAVMEKAQAEYIAKHHNNSRKIRSTSIDTLITEYVIATPKNSTLNKKINRILEQLESSGYLHELKIKWGIETQESRDIYDIYH
ncbi:ABC transporter substrate-binding protein [Rickettsiales endosymbiont of Paramecium tredecaurelia]|uniref:ABC transporter substrate-binding protein n=1 Tax=Candidatus Sarmatiella mevalonica TaxID=2770581 RepID=UPI0019244933|nr:ABC transporter substrate-binding protein [Candidatus Sarmatiella mevalonica]MBL3285199.1 ABC transporter substrate-binding protein [Candidatus Sarmatiella mevalonica]